MTRNWLRFSGLLALVMVVGCDDGSKRAPKNAAAANTPARKSTKAAPKLGPKPTTDVKAATTPAKDNKAGATPTEPAPSGEAVPTEPVPSDEGKAEAVPTEPVPSDEGKAEAAPPTEATPTEATPTEEPPTEATPTEATPTEEPAETGTVTATGSEVNGIAIGTDVELKRLVLAHDVVKRQPVDPSTTFPEGQKVSLFVEAVNTSGEEVSVRVTWENTATGRRTAPTTVRIPDRKLHRTRAYRTMRKAGSYRCIVLGDGDQELASLAFTVQ
ncbi:MAG: hypothetical protein K0V04_42045 [Deltaproteobacteria bacterium]|nr:hypothetical protein [Deltaproteobacteria bacterium]